MAGALNAPRPAEWGWESALAHAGILSVEADDGSEAAILLQDASEVYKAHKVKALSLLHLLLTMKTVLITTKS